MAAARARKKHTCSISTAINHCRSHHPRIQAKSISAAPRPHVHLSAEHQNARHERERAHQAFQLQIAFTIVVIKRRVAETKQARLPRSGYSLEGPDKRREHSTRAHSQQSHQLRRRMQAKPISGPPGPDCHLIKKNRNARQYGESAHQTFRSQIALTIVRFFHASANNPLSLQSFIPGAARKFHPSQRRSRPAAEQD